MMFEHIDALPLRMHLVSVVLGAVLVLGCQTPAVAKIRTSADVPTNQLGLYISARSNGLVTQAFLRPIDAHGILPVGTTDKFSFSEEGGPEVLFLQTQMDLMAQIATKNTKFSVILTRGSERFVSTIEMPAPFSLRAYERYDEIRKDTVIDVRWTPSVEKSEMVLLGEYGGHEYTAPPQPEINADFASRVIPRQTIADGPYTVARWDGSSGLVITATRTGGKITLHPALADVPHAGKLEQIRVVMTEPLDEPKPPAAVEVSP